MIKKGGRGLEGGNSCASVHSSPSPTRASRAVSAMLYPKVTRDAETARYERVKEAAVNG